jgi:hypothetical protein
MCLGFFSTVPGLDSSATNTIMAGSSSPFSASRAEMNILEINKKLCFQLEETKQQLRDLKEKFLISEATVYSLANQLWKYSKCCRFTVTQVMNEHVFSLCEMKCLPNLILRFPSSNKFHPSHIPRNIEVIFLPELAEDRKMVTQSAQGGTRVKILITDF